MTSNVDIRAPFDLKQVDDCIGPIPPSDNAVCFFGSSFNPVTLGHKHIVERLLSVFGLVVLLPVYQHIYAEKRDLAPYESRVDLVTRQFAKIGDTVQISDLERRVAEEAIAGANDARHVRVGTYDVLLAASKDEAFAGKRLFLVLGADTTKDLCNGRWKNRPGLLKLLAGIVVIPRKDVPLPSKEELAEKLDSKCIVWDMETPDVSSTAVRACVRSGYDHHHGMDPHVFERMKELGLYSNDASTDPANPV